MAASSSSTVNQTEIGGVRTENVPMQVINLRLTKENYFSWSPAMTMGIAARDRMIYIDGSNPEPAKTSGVQIKPVDLFPMVKPEEYHSPSLLVSSKETWMTTMLSMGSSDQHIVTARMH
ncbi:hypothetical protein EJ110_NYTH48517 [Nymphaea thermarum]|nr:hypothetical protein EJ110_NYTH48517 [Nymphaea thermarum]